VRNRNRHKNKRKSHIKRKWKRWLEDHIRPEIEYLLRLKAIYKTLGKIFTNSKRYPQRSTFYWYLGVTYSTSIVAGIYRLIDNRNDVISLLRLLNGIKQNPELISRRAYTRLNLKNESDFTRACEKRRLNEEFTEWAGSGEYIDSEIVTKDLQRINEVSKPLVKFRHKYIGHHAYNQKSWKGKIPTYRDVHKCIDELTKIFRRYYLLITHCNWNLTDKINDIKREINAFFEFESDKSMP